MKITLIRHAEVVEEYRGKYNGHIDIGLSQNGKLQAKEVVKKLQNREFDRVYCSDLLRAKETLLAFNLTCERTFTPHLREKSWGVHEGMSFEEIEASGIKYRDFNQWIEALDGEDIQTYIKRVKEYFFETILQESANQVLVITHAGVIKTLLSLIKHISLEEAFSIALPYSSFISLELLDNRELEISSM